MKTNTKRIVLLSTLSLAMAAAGCQLIVDFDRTKIDAGAVDASFDVAKPDNSVPDTGNDVTPQPDSGKDASDGAVSDASDASTSDASDAAADADDGSADAATE